MPVVNLCCRAGTSGAAQGGGTAGAGQVAGGIREVRDAVFLHGYTEPVLLLLHEPEPTWAGRYRWGVRGGGGGVFCLATQSLCGYWSNSGGPGDTGGEIGRAHV